MDLRPLKKLTGLDYSQSRTVQYTEEFIAQLMPNKFLVGSLIEADVSSTATSFDHRLGRTPVGWIILDKDGNANVWRTAWDDKTISFDATGGATLKVWVF